MVHFRLLPIARFLVLAAALSCASPNARAGETQLPQPSGYSTTAPNATYSAASDERAPAASDPGDVAARPPGCYDTASNRGLRTQPPAREIIIDIDLHKRLHPSLPRGVPIGEIAVDLDNGATTLSGVPGLKRLPRLGC